MYSDAELHRLISESVIKIFEKNPIHISQITEELFVQLKPIVKDMKRAYTISELRELLS